VGQHTVNVRVNGPRSRDLSVRSGHAMVPIIPPRYRPARSRLPRLHILWEVPAWTLVAPIDPALLRHLRGDLWAVLATWDLTPLERAVLSQRGRS
jgi:hypothetical protein